MSFDTVGSAEISASACSRSGRPLGCLVQVELAVVSGVGQPHHPRREVEVLVGPGDRRLRRRDEPVRDGEHLLAGIRVRERVHLILGRHAGRRGRHQLALVVVRVLGQEGLRLRAGAGGGRELPRVVGGVEGLRVGQVVAAVDGGLDGEDVRGVAQVGVQLRAQLRQGDEHVGERGRVRLQDRVLRVGVVEGHLPRVGVDDDLDRVADVVVAGRQVAPDGHLLAARVLRVGVVGRRRVPVDHPVDVPVVDHGVGVVIEGEERRRLLRHGHRVADEHDARLVRDLARDQQVEVAQPQGESRPGEDGGELDATAALVVALDAGAVLLVVHLGLL